MDERNILPCVAKPYQGYENEILNKNLKSNLKPKEN